MNITTPFFEEWINDSPSAEALAQLIDRLAQCETQVSISAGEDALEVSLANLLRRRPQAKQLVLPK